MGAACGPQNRAHSPLGCLDSLTALNKLLRPQMYNAEVTLLLLVLLFWLYRRCCLLRMQKRQILVGLSLTLGEIGFVADDYGRKVCVRFAGKQSGIYPVK